MKERVLIQGVVSEVQFPNKGKLIPADEQPSITEVAAPAGILYVEPTKTYGPLSNTQCITCFAVEQEVKFHKLAAIITIKVVAQ